MQCDSERDESIEQRGKEERRGMIENTAIANEKGEGYREGEYRKTQGELWPIDVN